MSRATRTHRSPSLKTRSRPATRISELAALATLTAVTLTGCGSASASKNEARFQCILHAENAAAAKTAARAYAAGSLGTAGQVRREVRQLKIPGVSPTSFLDARGRMIPFDRLSDAQRTSLSNWLELVRVHRIIGNDVDRAVADARERAQGTCPH